MKRRRTKLAAPDARSISGSGRGPTSARTDPMAHRALVGALALLAWDARSRDQPQHYHQLVRPERRSTRSQSVGAPLRSRQSRHYPIDGDRSYWSFRALFVAIARLPAILRACWRV